MNLAPVFTGSLRPTMPFTLCAKVSFSNAGTSLMQGNLIYVLRKDFIWNCTSDLSDGAIFEINSDQQTFVNGQICSYDFSNLISKNFSISLSPELFTEDFFNIPIWGFNNDIVIPSGANSQNGLFCNPTKKYPNSLILKMSGTLFMIPFRSFTYANVPLNLNPALNGFAYLISWVYSPSSFKIESGWLDDCEDGDCLNQFSDPTHAFYGYWPGSEPLCNCENNFECVRNPNVAFKSEFENPFMCVDPFKYGVGIQGIQGPQGQQGDIGIAGIVGRQGDRGTEGVVVQKEIWGSSQSTTFVIITFVITVILLLLYISYDLIKK